ncbi:MAG: hypothetical protein JNM57_02550 [Cyclobacteriaceae bacterium]|nr:hypothetical protein [Cyclobacteriaceae bacterium]
MKLSFLKFRTSLFLKKNKTSRTNLPYQKANSIGIIFSVEDKPKHDGIKELIKKFEHDGKRVQVIEFLPKQKDNYEFLFDFFTEKDLSFWGNITSHNALAFADTPFDFIYYIDKEPNPYILHLLARCKAKCRVGKFWEEGKPYFELMIESSNGIRGLMDEMYRYTSALK